MNVMHLIAFDVIKSISDLYMEGHESVFSNNKTNPHDSSPGNHGNWNIVESGIKHPNLLKKYGNIFVPYLFIIHWYNIYSI